MRHFEVRTITGQIDPHTLLVGLWPGPQWSRMLVYSVVIHVCLAILFVLLRALDLSFQKLPAVVYNVEMFEYERPVTKAPQKIAKAVQPPAPKKPEPKPEPKPQPKPEPPKPKAEVKKPAPQPEKKVEVAKAAKVSTPKKEQAETNAPPELPQKEEAPPPAPEPVQVAREVVPEPAPVATSTVDLDTEQISSELKWYIEMVRRKVWQNWIEPGHMLAPGAHAKVVIRFEIRRDGRFASTPLIYQSSNISLLDQSGYRAVLRSAPFPPLPESYSGDTLGVRFGFEYGEQA